LAPLLPKLSVVELDIQGNQPDREEYRDDDGPDLAIEYIFLILRDGDTVEVRLINVKE
jgi:hypothetical protein